MVRPEFIRLMLQDGLLALADTVGCSLIALWAALGLCAGCALAPRSQVEECHQLSRTLRSENARLKDQLLVAQAQNRDFADRAEDDARRLAKLG